MKNFAITLLTLISFTVSGQITIDNSHMPSNGDSLRFSLGELDTTLVPNYKNSGANLTWNYDSLVPIRQGVREFIASSQSPYSVTNRIAEKLADTLNLGGTEVYDVFNFYSSDTSSFSLTDRGATVPTGLGFPFPSTLKVVQTATVSVDKDEIYQFPLDYLDRDSSTYNLEYSNSLLGVYVGSSGYRINDVDAWGSLTTPYGTFNCIRVVTDIVGYDTVDAGSTTTGINSHQREYKWLTTQFEIPALIISGTVDSGIFVPSAIQYRDSVRNVPSLFVPIPQFSTTDTVVGIGDTVTISNSSVSFLSTNYQWDIQPTTFQYINGTSASSDSVIIIINGSGSYDVKLTATNSSGSDSLLKEDYIRVDTPIPFFTASDTLVAIGDTVNFSNSSRSFLPANYQWDIQPTTFQYINGTSANSDSITLVFNDTGYYDVKLVATSSGGSDSLLRMDYILVDLLVPLFTANDTLVTLGDTVNFSNLSMSFLPASYQWDIQPTNFQYINGTTANTDSITVVFSDTGFYDVKLIATSLSGSDSLFKEDYIRVDIPVGIRGVNQGSNSFTIFPNPLQKGEDIYISIEGKDRIREIIILDLKGSVIRHISAGQQKKQFQFKGPGKEGVYILQLISSKGKVNRTFVVH